MNNSGKSADNNNSAKKHYDELLAEVYSWMSGDFNERVNQTKEFFIKHNIKLSAEISTAIDLGSGHGIQTAALAALGFKVIAIDFNERLLTELQEKTISNVEIINADITAYDYSGHTPELVVCMGDTLTHLNNIMEVNNILLNAYNSLKARGKLVVSYRDLTGELKDTQRFINVKNDENRILTCFLEYFEDYVNVTDILHSKENGKWSMRSSSYRKLRISKQEIENILKTSGFKVTFSEQINGMLLIISEK